MMFLLICLSVGYLLYVKAKQFEAQAEPHVPIQEEIPIEMEVKYDADLIRELGE